MTRTNHRTVSHARFSAAKLVAMAMVAAPLGSLMFSSCASAIPPFATPYQEHVGFKARAYKGTAEDIRPMVVQSLEDLGYEVHPMGDDAAFVSATQGMGTKDPALAGGRRTWIRVGVEVRQVDMHRRAPRTLVTVEAENVQGTSDGPINASFGAVPSDFYQSFFERVESRVKAANPVRVRGFMPPA